MNHAVSSSAREKSIWPMFVGAFVLFVLFAGGVQWMLSSGDRESFDEEAIRSKQRYEILAKVQEENTALTGAYAWADQAKGTVRIPVDRAVELTLARLTAQGAPRPAYPVDPASVMGSAVKPGGFAVPQPTPPPFTAPAAPPPSAPPAPADAAPVEVAP